MTSRIALGVLRDFLSLSLFLPEGEVLSKPRVGFDIPLSESDVSYSLRRSYATFSLSLSSGMEEGSVKPRGGFDIP